MTLVVYCCIKNCNGSPCILTVEEKRYPIIPPSLCPYPFDDGSVPEPKWVVAV